MTKRILIVDDERDMQVYLRTLLRKAGYETAVAADGDEALSLAEEFGPDLITLDLVMPRRSGTTVYEALRTSPGTRHIPVIILTGVATRADMFDGGDPVIPRPEAVMDKPIDRAAFLRTVEEYVGGED
jgi:two-component system, OmpR family, alkaline phosphatase synthesis response regulator PhoP